MKRRSTLRLVGQDDPGDILDDLDKLGADSFMPAQLTPSRKWRRYGTMVPREWELRLQRATRVSTYKLAHELLYRHWKARQGKGRFGRTEGPVVVSHEMTRTAALSLRSMGNALDELEKLGLVAVLRAKNRSPRAFPLLVLPTNKERTCRLKRPIRNERA